MKINLYRIPLLLFLFLLVLASCVKNVDGTWKAPFVYRLDVQQGNQVDQEMINKLRPGMDKNQVKFIMGTPLISDPFHSNRWDYVYSFEPGRGERQQRRITVYFKDDKLHHVDGDIQITDKPVIAEEKNKERSVDVPLDTHQDGFFSGWFDPDQAEDAAAETGSEESGAGDTETAAETEDSADTKPEPVTAATHEEDKTGTSVGGEPVPETAPAETVATDVPAPASSETEDDTEETLAEKEQEKNLIKRFWERMTSGSSESGIEEGVESERDRRDAEVLEDAGGDL